MKLETTDPLIEVLQSKQYNLGEFAYVFADPWDASAAIRAGFTPLKAEYESYRSFPTRDILGGTLRGSEAILHCFSREEQFGFIANRLNEKYGVRNWQLVEIRAVLQPRNRAYKLFLKNELMRARQLPPD